MTRHGDGEKWRVTSSITFGLVWLRLCHDRDNHLTQRTTLDEFAAAWGKEQLADRRRDKWLAFRSEVEAALAEGGELWEWESTRFRELAGVCGLAVVRDGTVVREWQVGKS